MSKERGRIAQLLLVLAVAIIVGCAPSFARADNVQTADSSATVDEQNSLQQAINAAAEGGTVALSEDVTVDHLTISSDKNITLDLGGHTLTLSGGQSVSDSAYETGATAAALLNEGTLSISNGKLSGSGTACLIVNRGSLTLTDGVTVSKSGEGNVIDNLAGSVTTSAEIASTAQNYTGIVTYGGSVVVSGGTIKCDYGISVFNRAFDNESAGADVTISGGSISADVFALSTNNIRSGGSTPSNVTITGGSLSSARATAIYWPSAGTLAIGETGGSDDTVSVTAPKGSAIEVCSGSLVINSGTFSGSDSNDALNASTSMADAYRKNSGCAGMGDAVSIIARRGSGYDTAALRVKINGGTFSSSDNYAVRYFDCNQVVGATQIKQDVSVSISGGTFTEAGTAETAVDASVVAAAEQKFITGGSYSNDVSAYVPTGYSCSESGSNNYVVSEVANGAMTVTSDSGAEGTVSATLDGIFKGSLTQIDGGDEGGATDEQPSGEIAGNAVTIDLATDDGAEDTSATLTVTESAAASLAENNASSLTVVTNVGTVELDATALGKMGADGTGDVTIKVEKNSAGSNGVLASYTVSVTSDGMNVLPYGADDNGTVTITVAKPATASEGQDLQAWYVVNGSEGSYLYVEKLEMTESGENALSIRIGHLSTVVLVNGDPENQAVATVTGADGAVAHYSSLQGAIDAVSTDGSNQSTVTLLRNTQENVSISGSKNIKLDLNGFTLDGETTAGKAALTNDGGTITIVDSSKGGTGTIKRSDDGGKGSYYTILNSSGTMTIASGNVCNNSGSTTEWSGSSLICNGPKKSATLKITGGNISQENFIAVKNDEWGTLEITGGTIGSGNQAVQNWCVATLSGGTFNGSVTSWAYSDKAGETTITDDAYVNGDVGVYWYGNGSGDSYEVHEGVIPEATVSGGYVTGSFVKGSITEPNSSTAKPVEDSNAGGAISVKGGQFGKSVNPIFLDDSLKAELKSASDTDTPFSYHPTVAAAVAVAEPGDVVVEIADGSGDKPSGATVTLVFGNGAVDQKIETTVGAAYVLTAPTRAGYTFQGWSDGAKTYQAGAAYTVSGNVTLTALWSPIYVPTPSAPTYDVTVPEAEGGKVAVSDASPEEGDKVTVTATPDEGQEVREVSVTDAEGNEIEATRNEDGTYTFEMPKGDVTVEVTFGCDGGELCPTHSYADLDQAEWYHDAVDWAVTSGAILGYGDGTFGPGNALTRAEMATILCRLAGEPEADLSALPSDVPAGEWYANGVAWALAEGVFNGNGDGSFDPAGAITREQAACVLYNRAAAAGEDVSARADLSAFADADELSGWAEEAMSWAVAEGVFSGGAAGLEPGRALTRSEGAAILWNWETRSE